MVLLLIGLIIAVVVLYRDNDDLKKEIKRLKKPINYCPSCGYNLSKFGTNNIPVSSSASTTNNIFEKKNSSINKPVKEKKYTDKEIKNNLILITGSVLLILSALVFLSTTWSVSNSMLKFLVLLIMLIIFVISSYIADNILNIKYTAKAFYYISLAYIPIILLAVSLLGLIGDFYSITGPGKYVYLALSSIIITGIYYYSSKKNNSYLLGIASIIFSIISVILLGYLFTDNINIILVLLIVYSVILCIIYNFKIYYINNKTHSTTLLVLLSALVILIINNMVNNLIIGNTLITDVISDILILINIYFVLDIFNKKKIFDYIYPIVIIITFINTGFLQVFDNIFSYIQLMVLLSFVIISFYDIITKHYIKDSSFIEILVVAIPLLLISFEKVILNNINNIPLYILLITITIIISVYYYLSPNKSKDKAYLVAIFSIITVLGLVIDYHLSIIYISIASILMILLATLFKDKNELFKAFLEIGIISFVLVSILFTYTNIFILFLFTLFILLCIINHLLKHESIFKILAYLYIDLLVIGCLYFLNILSIDSFIVSLVFITIVLMLLENIISYLKDKTNNYYIIIHSIFIMITFMFLDLGINSFIFLVILTICYIYYFYSNNNPKELLFAPVLAFIPYLYISDILVFNSVNIANFLSIIILVLFAYLIYSKEDNNYIIMFYLYAFLQTVSLDNSKYVNLFIFFIGTFACYLIKKDKTKDFFEIALYFIILKNVQFIISDFGIDNISLFIFAPYMILFIIITRRFLKKWIGNDFKIIEYIGSIIICYIAFINYSSEMDGIIFVFGLTLLVIISYILKYGPVFLVSLVAILFNVLLLTRSFWLSIPWWIYILIIGIILISFAIYNELSEKKHNRIGKFLKGIDI